MKEKKISPSPDITRYCDLTCTYAELPAEFGLDGSGSCRTFLALYCGLKNGIVQKNMPCRRKKLRTND